MSMCTVVLQKDREAKETLEAAEYIVGAQQMVVPCETLEFSDLYSACGNGLLTLVIHYKSLPGLKTRVSKIRIYLREKAPQTRKQTPCLLWNSIPTSLAGNSSLLCLSKFIPLVLPSNEMEGYSW